MNRHVSQGHGSQEHVFKSVRARIRGWARAVDSLSATPFFQPADIQSPVASDLTESKLSEPLVDFLIQLDNKLNTVLGLMATEDMARDFPIHMNTVSVSGGELTFTLDRTVPNGQHLEVVLLLSRIPAIMVSAMGAVRPASDEEFGQVYAMELTRMREEDRDQVVGFVFQQERRSIRARWD